MVTSPLTDDKRNNIAAAKLAGLPEDLKLRADSGEFQVRKLPRCGGCPPGVLIRYHRPP